MLQKLTIRNYALIDSLDITFDRGLNIITGETGAGKSIILGALSLILGQRAESKYFFNQDKKCIIEGIFEVSSYNLKDFFEGLEIDFEPETILRREISADGKSRAFVNDTPVNLQVLKQVGERLIDIHSQHAVLEINSENFQLLTIDSLADHKDTLRDYSIAYKHYKKELQRLTALETAHLQAAKELDYHQFLFNELETAALKADEQEQLEQELEQLSNADAIKSNLLEATQLISDSEYAALIQLKTANNRLNQIERFNPEISILNQRLQSTVIELKDLAAELENMEQKIQSSPERMENISARLDQIYRLQQKHGVQNIAELLDIEENLSETILNYNTADDELIALRAATSEQKTALVKLSEQISAAREKVFSTVEQEIAKSLNAMGMANARLSIVNNKLPVDEFTSNGIDKVNFLFSANAGQAPAPLNKIASGGELSRFMLAVKSLISTHTALPTIIFDEIDTGISGDIALKVGQVMQNISSKLQVVTITHLPQIAAKGDTHFFVYKEEDQARTTTGIRKLNDNQRVEVIAEMLSGKNPGASALQNAQDLIRIN